MKKLLFETWLLALVLVFPIPTMARVDLDVSVSLPPLIVFAAPPEVVVLPETYVYVVPDADVDIFFYNGWWWRPWEGRWYRSRDYNSGWVHYSKVPSFYRQIPSDWRNDYREHHWKGHQWNHQRIPHQDVQQTWKSWEKSKYWEKQKAWGVQGLQHQTRSQQHREVGPQTRGSQTQHLQQQPQHSQKQQQHQQQQQGHHERGKAGKNGGGKN